MDLLLDQSDPSLPTGLGGSGSYGNKSPVQKCLPDLKSCFECWHEGSLASLLEVLFAQGSQGPSLTAVN
jgi:hypothetical protein